MSLNVGKYESYQTNPFLGLITGRTAPVTTRVATPVVSTKTKAVAAIPYEKSPVVTDTVPTKYADGTPLLAGYVTPNVVWTC